MHIQEGSFICLHIEVIFGYRSGRGLVTVCHTKPFIHFNLAFGEEFTVLASKQCLWSRRQWEDVAGMLK